MKTILQYAISFGLIALATVALLTVAAVACPLRWILNYENSGTDNNDQSPGLPALSGSDGRMDNAQETANWERLLAASHSGKIAELCRENIARLKSK